MPASVYVVMMAILLLLGGCRSTPTPAPEVARQEAPSAPAQTAEGVQGLAIDFQTCAPHKQTIAVAFGSTTYAIIGLADGLCVMRYGGEIENPGWDGRLNILCRVPPALGLQRFAVGDLGVDFSALAPQCIIE